MCGPTRRFHIYMYVYEQSKEEKKKIDENNVIQFQEVHLTIDLILK